jgi:hypothetical protein
VSELACDRCGRSLLVHEDVRYKVEMRVWAAYDPMEISEASLAGRDLDAEIKRLLAACENRTAEELEAEVWKKLDFDLCLRCHKEFLQNPLPRREGGEDPPSPSLQ